MRVSEAKQTTAPEGSDAETAVSPPTAAPEEQQEILPRPFIGDILPDPLHWFTYS